MTEEEAPPTESFHEAHQSFVETLVRTRVDAERSGAAHSLAEVVSLVAPRYRVDQELGRGAMGSVFRVFDRELEEEVALKVLHPRLVRDRRGALLFRREVKLARRITHPNIARIFDLHVSGDVPFLTMELIDGRGLELILAEGALDVDMAVDYAIEILEALEAAHQAGVVHRDLKPGNIIVTKEGRVVVTDFGIATTVKNEHSGEVMVGTAFYLAPEQARAMPVDGRADLYALGCLFYQMLAGEVPWRGTNLMQTVMLRLVNDPPTLPESIPAEIRDLVNRLIAREPSNRPATAREAIRTLETFRGDNRPRDSRSTRRLPGLAVTGVFVGRREELEKTKALLEDQQVMEYVGVGGSGKTRLAQEFGNRHAREFSGGVVCAELMAASDAREMVAAVASALDLGGPAKPTEQVAHALRERGPCLLILDGAENLTHALPSIVARWCHAAPEARFLITSRVRLPLETAVVVDVGPLEVAEAMDLFGLRAREVRSEFSSAEHRESIRAIVESVDCLPLAIDLAAARLRIMTPETILDRLDDRLRLLRTRYADGRHAALEAVLAESWELLPRDCRRALAQLSVFEGGATLAGASRVISVENAWPEELIETLWDHCLLKWEKSTDRIRFPAIVREYALRRLQESGDEPAARDRHLRVMVGFAETSLGESVSERVLHRATLERQNLMSAFDHACDTGRAEEALMCLRALWQVLDSDGPYDLGIELSDRLAQLELPDNESRQWLIWVRAGALWRSGRNEEASGLLNGARDWDSQTDAYPGVLVTLGNVQWALGQIAAARETYEHVLEIAVARRMLEQQGVVLGNLGLAEWNAGNLSMARRHFEASIAIHRERGSDEHEGIGLSNLALIEAEEGNNVEAIRLIRAAIEKHRAADDTRSEALALTNLSSLLREEGQLQAAEKQLEKALAENRRLGNRQMIGIGLTNQGNLLLDQGRPREALVTLAQALRYHEENGDLRFQGITRRHRAAALTDLDRPDEAREEFEEAADVLSGADYPVELVRVLCDRVEFELELGDSDAARAALAVAERVTEQLDPAAEIVGRVADLRAKAAFSGSG